MNKIPGYSNCMLHYWPYKYRTNDEISKTNHIAQSKTIDFTSSFKYMSRVTKGVCKKLFALLKISQVAKSR